MLSGEEFWKRDPAFEALSYVWGSQKDPTTAAVEFMQRNSIDTIEDSLHWPRSSNMSQKSSIYNDSARMLWIDKTCLHFNRCGKNHRRNARLGLPFSKGFRYCEFSGINGRWWLSGRNENSI